MPKFAPGGFETVANPKVAAAPAKSKKGNPFAKRKAAQKKQAQAFVKGAC